MIWQRVSKVAFWFSLGILAYTYVGFPVLVLLRAIIKPQPFKGGPYLPRISVIIAAHNEEAVIAKKIENTLALDYPPELFEVIVASDGSDDRTIAIVATYQPDGVRLLARPREGKNRALNAAVAEATGEILVFTDADILLERQSLRSLMEPFIDPSVGGVGTFAPDGSGSAASSGISVGSLKHQLKQLESQGGQITSASGALYAIRRSLFSPIPPGVSDDFFVSLRVPAASMRLVLEPRAVWHEISRTTASSAVQRRVRVVTRAIYTLWVVRQLLNPFRYGFFAIQLLSHKVLQRLSIIPSLLLMSSAPLLWRQGRLYRVIALGQITWYAAALTGYGLRGTRFRKVLRIPTALAVDQVVVVRAIINLVLGKRRDVWMPQRVNGGSGSSDTSEEIVASEGSPGSPEYRRQRVSSELRTYQPAQSAPH